MARCRISAAAQIFVIRSEMVGLTSVPCSSTRRSRSASARVMSTVIPSWKTGASQASVSRRAIVLRIDDSCCTSTPSLANDGVGSVTGAPEAAVRSTSSATTRPSGPVPATALRSTPRSRAIRRASGEALMRPPFSSDGCLISATRSLISAEARRPRSLSCSRARAGEPSSTGSPDTSRAAEPFPAGSLGSSLTCSPCSPITAIVLPTSTSPEEIAIFSRTPEASASTSCVTLSVSSSYSGSPFSTLSPSDLSHFTIVPDSMPWPRRGSLTSVAIGTPYRSANCMQHIARVRHDELLHHRRERQWRELRPDALDRCVEPVERAVLDQGGDLRAEASAHDRLVGDDAAIGLLHRRDQRVLVEREKCARIHDLDGDALLFRLLGRGERLVNEPAGRDHRDVLALAMRSRLAERNRLELLRDVLSDPV